MSVWSVGPFSEISGRASPAGLSPEASSTKEPLERRNEQQDRREQGTQNPHTFNTFPWWGCPRYNAPLPYINHKIGAASYPKLGNGSLLPSWMGRWGLSITKEINTILNTIYSTLGESRPPLNLQFCFLNVLVVDVCALNTWLSTIVNHVLK